MKKTNPNDMKITCFLLLLLLLAAPACLPAQTATDPPFCSELLDSATLALHARNWNRARDYCETALPLCPGIGIELTDVLDKATKGVLGEKALVETKRKEAAAERDKARNALAAANIANEQVVASFLRDADVAIKNMDYELALDKITTAADLKVKQDEVFHRYLEIAYWYSETGKPERAIGILDTALTMVGKPKLSATLGKQPTRGQLREAMEKLDKKHYDSLLRRYYPSLVPIKGGTFQMGCDSISSRKTFGEDFNCREDEKQHTVTLDDYYMAETETTWWQYGLYRAANGKNVWENRASWQPTGDHPVVDVNWYDAIEYSNWVSQQFPELEKDTVYSGDLRSDEVVADFSKNGYRLPTEAEWEYAASTGLNSVFAGTSSPDSLHFFGNYNDNSGSMDGAQYTSAVKKYRPNRWQLFDMSGNVWEWCWDRYAENYYKDGQQNPPGPDEGGDRVLRGGSWGYVAVHCRTAYRDGFNPDYRNDDYGFRLVSLP